MVANEGGRRLILRSSQWQLSNGRYEPSFMCVNSMKNMFKYRVSNLSYEFSFGAGFLMSPKRGLKPRLQKVQQPVRILLRKRRDWVW